MRRLVSTVLTIGRTTAPGLAQGTRVTLTFALCGKEFADGQVAFGKTLRGVYDDESAWNWALAMSREERLSKFAQVVKANGK